MQASATEKGDGALAFCINMKQEPESGNYSVIKQTHAKPSRIVLHGIKTIGANL